MSKKTKKATPVIDGTKPGYEADIATDPAQFLDDDRPGQEELIAVGIAAIPSPVLNGALLVQETEEMVINGIRVKYRKVPAMLFSTARAAIKTKLENSKPAPQEFIADKDGTRVVGDQNPVYHEALEIWEKENKNIDTLVSTALSLFSGLILVDGMPPDDAWLPSLQEMFELSGLDWDSAFQSFMYEPDKIKELMYKQYVVLGNALDMNNFTDFQNTGDVAVLTASPEASSAMFRAQAE